jgi:hypothetical protein
MADNKYIPKVDYSLLTINDPNPIKRRLQNLRLSQSLKSLINVGSNFSGNILDFGAGNAELIKRLAPLYANFKNIFKATVGRRINERNLIYIDEKLPYYTRHIGFDYRKLENRIHKHFVIDQKYGSPFTWLPFIFNFEIYFSCIKRD